MEIVTALRYERLREIGAGQGMNSKVYEATDLGRRCIVAVKEIEKAHLDRQGVTDYFQEAMLMHAAKHSHIVPIESASSTGDHVVLMMPLFRQGSVADRIRDRPLGLREARRVGLGMLHGLTRIHIAGAIHYDIKPSNLLIGDNDEPLVSDFGQARMIGPLGVAARPPMYPYAIPPEVFNGHVGTVHSDVWQAGLCLYRMLNGEPFHQTGMHKQVAAHGGNLNACRASGTLVDADSYLPHVPRPLRRVVRKALARDPADRYASAEELSDALASVEIKVDWQMAPIPNGMCWSAARKDQPTLVVELLEGNSHNRWNVKVYTERSGYRRAKNRQDFWVEGLTRTQANEHLRKVVFANL